MKAMQRLCGAGMSAISVFLYKRNIIKLESVNIIVLCTTLGALNMFSSSCIKEHFALLYLNYFVITQSTTYSNYNKFA
jgi:hypothetical protein